MYTAIISIQEYMLLAAKEDRSLENALIRPSELGPGLRRGDVNRKEETSTGRDFYFYGI